MDGSKSVSPPDRALASLSEDEKTLRVFTEFKSCSTVSGCERLTEQPVV